MLQDIFAKVASLDAAIWVASYLETIDRHCNPSFSRDRRIDFRGIAHPLLREAVENDYRSDGRSALVTGSNMAGKSTFIKAIGVNMVLTTSHEVELGRPLPRTFDAYHFRETSDPDTIIDYKLHEGHVSTRNAIALPGGSHLREISSVFQVRNVTPSPSRQLRRPSDTPLRIMILQRTCMTVLAALALIAGPATAVEYVPPDGTGWWQLQSSDGTYTEVCAEGTGPCDPPPGTYLLIDFATSPATRTSVTIEAPGGTDSERVPELFVTAVSGVGSNGDDGTTQASVTCPEGKVVVGGACNARSLSNQGRIIPAFGQVVDLEDRREYMCETSEPAFVIVAEATCF